MKDAKGHGSEKRGAHAAGVEQVGRTINVPIQQLRAIQSWDNEKDNAKIEGVRQAMQSGESMKPVKVVSYAGSYLLSDGHHRAEAANREGHLSVPATLVSPRSYLGKSAIKTANDYIRTYRRSPWKWGGLRGVD